MTPTPATGSPDCGTADSLTRCCNAGFKLPPPPGARGAGLARESTENPNPNGDCE